MKRLFDIITSFIFLLLLSPLLIIFSIWIIIDSKGGIFFGQSRVGRDNKNFKMFKFRTMRPGSDAKGLLTVGDRDPRVTNAGHILRKTKLDELPQLINILKGDMSVVGPRPEVRKYVDLYNAEQMQVLNVRPGLTDYASLEYINESEILGKSSDPDKTYIESIMPAKLALNIRYIQEQSLGTDLKIIFKTISKIF